MTRDERAHAYLLALMANPQDWNPAKHNEFVKLAFKFADEFIRQSAAQETPLPEIEDADGWIEWKGGDCPIPDGTKHIVKFRCGEVSSIDDTTESWGWGAGNGSHNIIAYKIVK